MTTHQISGNILVIVPHSDDEILMFGGLIQRALAEQKTVHVCLVTNGDYEASTYDEGIVRPQETIQGLKILGLPEENIYLLGYADTGMPKQESFLWRLWESRNADEVYESHVGTCTYGPENHPDFHSAEFGTQGAYTKKNLQTDIQRLMEKLQPQSVYTTHSLDAHGDHAGLYEFVKEAYGTRHLYTGFCHCSGGDSIWPLPGDRFTCPPDLQESKKCSEVLELSEAEAALKAAALEAHQAALKPDAVTFLRSFNKKDEIYFKTEESL